MSTHAAPHSAIAETLWPAVPNPVSALMLALIQQFERSERWPRELVEEQQFRQLRPLLEHAYLGSPFHRARLEAIGYRQGQPITTELWQAIPVLTRRELQENWDEIVCKEIPKAHGRVLQDSTSGSSGMPVKILKTDLMQRLWEAATLRDELWQGRDFQLKMGVIRRDPEGVVNPSGRRLENWGAPVATVYPTGPLVLMDSRNTTDQQAEWLLRERPDYLLSFPSILKHLARHLRGSTVPPLRGVRTFGELVEPELRALSREVFGAEVADVYSAAEVGYMALQCPAHEHYHVQSELVRLEVLDADGRTCAPGVAGRIVVTPLHNFAMPLLRYAIGDDGVLDATPCPCGRTLPVLRDIRGRARDMLLLPSGARRFSMLGTRGLAGVPGLLQIQVVQKSMYEIETRLVTRPGFGPPEEEQLTAHLHRALGEHLAVRFTYHAEIPRAPSGKYVDFVCEVQE